jgi:hypothetical protein
MTDFSYLTPDKKVQRTSFANGVVVIANFSEKPYACAGGRVIAPFDYAIEGI